MQPCWHKNCDFDGMVDLYYPEYDRTYPGCYKHYITDKTLQKADV